jgi:peptidoglycan/LPS O-acetylase OafA/YrhL
MKLKDYKIEYQWYSGKASDIVRHLSFAGIAIIWIFKSQSQNMPKIPDSLLLPLALFCVSLGSDLLQYVSGYLIWFIFYRYQEMSGIKNDDEIEHSSFLPLPLHIFMLIKVTAVIIAYYMIIEFIYNAGAPLLSVPANQP